MTINETSQVYLAEFELRDMLELTRVHVHGAVVEMPVERRFASLDSVQDYVNRVLALNWVRARYPNAALPLVVKRHKVINQARCGGGVMYVNPDHTKWQLREIVILHELAHHLAGAGHDHNLSFRQVFLDLVDEIIGAQVGWVLRTLFWDRGLQTMRDCDV